MDNFAATNPARLDVSGPISAFQSGQQNPSVNAAGYFLFTQPIGKLRSLLSFEELDVVNVLVFIGP